ncbi:MAG: transcription-repair coupling factor [Nannocystaceae bacterium]|nr:transcription-repair coupling factor [Nannocystaceae bacterium]
MATSSPNEAASLVTSALTFQRRLRVLGADGSTRGLLLARAAESGGGPIFYVAPDEAAARTVATDAAFFLGVAPPGGSLNVEGPIVLLPEPDTSPYADVSPDPRAVGARLAVLSRLSGGDGPTQDPIPDPGADPDDARTDDVPRIVVASLRALMRRVMPVEGFTGLCRRWCVEQELPRDEAIEILVAAGYVRADVVEDPGTFAVRGGVMDLWVPRLRFPVRLEWFDDEIERMRLFDPDSQRSQRAIKTLLVHPVRETVQTTEAPLRPKVLALADAAEVPSSKTSTILENLNRGQDFFGIDALAPLFHDRMDPVWRYVGDDVRWLVEEPAALAALAERLASELTDEHARALESRAVVAPPDAFGVSAAEVLAMLDTRPVVFTRMEEDDVQDGRSLLRVEAEANVALRGQLAAARVGKAGEILRPVVDHIRRLVTETQPWCVVLVAPNLTHAERLTSLLRGYGLPMLTPRNATEVRLDAVGPDRGVTSVQVVAGELSAGLASETDRFIVLSEADLFGRVTRKARARRRTTAGLGNLAQLSIGDYVVHVTHGVGRYIGMTKLSLQGIPADFVLIEYAAADKLYLPVYRVSEIERYVSAEAKAPKLDKMGGTTFQAKTNKIKAEVRQLAEELLQIYAQREAMVGHAYPEPDDMHAAFDASFPFEETVDQLDAIAAVASDLSAERPMDRLICGDVGFGKTEVALRAAFRVATAGKQVAVLAPTTVLVQQHFHTFTERMNSFGVRVAALNRFSNAAARKETIARIKDGTVDVVVGTHRLLSKDVRFKELGLVVIDEEQRFGVAQKERFKKLKSKVDVLSLSATPIPRTLHLSLIGLREISLIMTPPVDRLAVRTVLTRLSDSVLEEAITAELARGGQVFYVVPKITGIEEHAVRIRRLMPKARVLVAHGQMPPAMLEKAMVDFVEHRANVLVSTTIIESGLDIPRANTMFIARADMFGLSQLYQLRGRIGRSKRRAHCYLMVHSLERLAPEARRRLEAIQRHAELGSGFHIASEDLEIRGAGEILGGRQTGTIATIGFEAYARILAEAVAELRGQPIVSETDPEIAFDVPAFLPDAFIEDTGQRLDLYRRLSASADVDAVTAVMDEIKDRFGELPIEARHLGVVMACKTYGRRLEASALELRGSRLTIRLTDRTPLTPQVAAGLRRQTKARLVLAAEDRVVARLPPIQGDGRMAQLQAAQAALAELMTFAQ